MTEGQASYTLVQLQATYVTTKGGVQWWRLPTGEWVTKKRLGWDAYELRRLPAASCNCG